MTSPWLQVSPSFKTIFLIVPAFDAGISIDALSVSTTIIESPSLTTSPTATQISMTSTFSAPPKSGIIILLVAMSLSSFRQQLTGELGLAYHCRY